MEKQEAEYNELCEYVKKNDIYPSLDLEGCVLFIESIEHKFPLHHQIILQNFDDAIYDYVESSEISESIVNNENKTIKDVFGYYFASFINSEIEDFRNAGEIMESDEGWG